MKLLEGSMTGKQNLRAPFAYPHQNEDQLMSVQFLRHMIITLNN